MQKRIAKVRAYAGVMADSYLAARQKLAILEPFMAGEIPALFNNSYGAHAHGTLQLTLSLDLIRDACAFALDTNDRAPSLANIWRLLSASDLRKGLRDDILTRKTGFYSYDGVDDETRQRAFARWREQELADRAAGFDGACTELAAGIDGVLKSELACQFLMARDKTIAHYEMRGGVDGPKLFKLDDVGLTWDAPRRFFTLLDPVLWNAVLVATWGSYDTTGYDRAARLYAADFWARLRGQPPVNHLD